MSDGDSDVGDGGRIGPADHVRGLRLVLAGLNRDDDGASAVLFEARREPLGAAKLAVACADIAGVVLRQTVGVEAARDYLLHDLSELLGDGSTDTGDEAAE